MPNFKELPKQAGKKLIAIYHIFALWLMAVYWTKT